MELKVGSLFSGIGGLDIAVESFFNARTVWHCEFDAEPSKVLAARWPGVPNLGDVTAVDWAAVEPVDIMCGGFPCQDVSLAGRRAGMKDGTRSGLWSEFARAIEALKPKVVVIENVRGLLSAEAGSDVEPCPWCLGDDSGEPALRALGAVLGDLDELGFDAEWTGLRASDVGAPHGRFRVFIVAYARGVRLERGWPAWDGGAGFADGGSRESVTLLPTPIVSDGTGGPKNLDGALFAPQLREIGQLLPTPRAARGAASTETMYALGAERDDTGDRQGNVVGEVAWGPYEPAVRLWEQITRPAPPPTLPDGKNGNHRLSARFTEWMMGYPDGWVTDVIGRNPAIKACGNGVVPQQTFAALQILWPRVIESLGVTA